MLDRSHRVVLVNAAPSLSEFVINNATATLEEGTIQLDAPLFPLAPLLTSLLAGDIRSTLLAQGQWGGIQEAERHQIHFEKVPNICLSVHYMLE